MSYCSYPAARRMLHTSRRTLAGRPTAHPTPHSHSVKGGFDRSESTPLDAARRNPTIPKGSCDGATGNPEQIGFADQVGSQTRQPSREGAESMGGAKEANPGILGTIKRGLGIGKGDGDQR